MNKYIMRLSLPALLITASTMAMADDSFDISVIGNITPAACKANITGGHVFDYGDILAGSLSKDDFTVLPQKTSGFSIVCEAPAKIALKTIDNRPGTANTPVGKGLAGSGPLTKEVGVMGLGIDHEGNKIGAFLASISSKTVTVDGDQSVNSILSRDKGATWISNGDRLFFTTAPSLYSWAKGGETTPVSFTTLNGEIDVQAAIAPASELNLSQPVKMDGSATISLFYL